MADDFNKLAVLIEANTRSYENAMKRIEQKTGSAFANIERQSKRLDASFSRIGGSLGRIGAGLAAGLSIGGAVKFADAFTRIENSLKVAGLAGEEFANVQARLFDISQKNGTSFEALAGLYGKLSLAQSSLGVTSSELVGFTDTIGTALKVSGVSAEQASGALLQLSQALGSGTVRAEEFNSILEGAPAIAQAAAAGLKEAGGEVAVLRQLVAEGAVSSKVFFQAIEAGADMLKSRAAGATDTMSQAMTRLDNAMTLFVGNVDDATGGSEALAAAVNSLADGLVSTAQWFDTNTENLRYFIDLLKDGYRIMSSWPQWARDKIGISAALDKSIGTWGDGPIWNQPNGKQAGNAIKEMFGGRGDYSFLPDPRGAFVPGDPRLGNKPGSMPAAKNSGKPVSISSSSPSSAGEFKDVARAAEAATTSAADFSSAIEDVGAKTNATADALSSFASGFAQDMMQGTKATEALNGALNRLASQLLEKSLSAVIGGIFAGGVPGADPWAGLRSLPGRAMGGPVTGGKPYMVGERGPELFVPSTSGKISANGGASNIHVSVQNYSGAPVTTAGKGTQADPMRIIVGAVSRGFQDGKFNGDMASKFGVRPMVKNR
jgi:tape measure domain-containing protein